MLTIFSKIFKPYILKYDFKVIKYLLKMFSAPRVLYKSEISFSESLQS